MLSYTNKASTTFFNAGVLTKNMTAKILSNYERPTTQQ